LTSDFVYIRRHGRDGSDSACYSTDELKKDAKLIKAHLRKKMDVFVYFNNDVSGYAPKNAEELLYLTRKRK